MCPDLDVVSKVVVAASFPQNTVAPIRIIPGVVHLKPLVDENQSIDNLSAMMKGASPLPLHRSTFEYYTIYSQVALIPTQIEITIELNSIFRLPFKRFVYLNIESLRPSGFN